MSKKFIGLVIQHTTERNAQADYQKFIHAINNKVVTEGWHRDGEVAAVQDDDVIIYTQMMSKGGESTVSA